MWFRLHRTGSIAQTQMSLGIDNLMIDIVRAMEAKMVNEIGGGGGGGGGGGVCMSVKSQ